MEEGRRFCGHSDRDDPDGRQEAPATQRARASARPADARRGEGRGACNMVKQVQVHGGCLKERGGDEGRDKLRKAAPRSTYPLRGADGRMGQPARQERRAPCGEHIAGGGHTPRSEPSK